MTAYMGGKKRIGKRLAEIIQEDIDAYNIKTYREPFVGMAGVAQHINTNNIIICDLHPDVVALWKKVINTNWKPPCKMSNKEYERWRAYKKPHHMRAFAGFGASFSGSFFSAYRKQNVAKSARSLIATAKNMRSRNVKVLTPKSYDKHNPKINAVYCDPPYRNTRGYRLETNGFDHDAFWKTMIAWSKNNIVYISERTLPPMKYRKHFKVVFKSKFRTTALTQNVGEVREYTEYMLRSKVIPMIIKRRAH